MIQPTGRDPVYGSSPNTRVLPKGVRFARTLLAVEAVILLYTTTRRVLVVAVVGVAPGWPLSKPTGMLLLAAAGSLFSGACAIAFVLLGKPSCRFWWSWLGILAIGTGNFAAAIMVIPQEKVDAILVIDVYLVDLLIPLVVAALLFGKRSRRYFT